MSCLALRDMRQLLQFWGSSCGLETGDWRLETDQLAVLPSSALPMSVMSDSPVCTGGSV
jgi:hypothetical protein